MIKFMSIFSVRLRIVLVTAAFERSISRGRLFMSVLMIRMGSGSRQAGMRFVT